MDVVILSLISDAIVMVLLVATMIYVMRLSSHLKKFKKNREELKGIISDLSMHIDRAQKAINDLHTAADEAGHDLKQRMEKANRMFDELDIVVQTGDALANRLEDLAVRNRKIVEGGQSDIVDLEAHMTDSDDTSESRAKKLMGEIDKQTQKNKGFAIQDREAEAGAGFDRDGFTLDDNEVLSEAERDLYEALQKSKSARGGRKAAS